MHAEQVHNQKTETTESDLIQEHVSDILTDFFILAREKLTHHLAALSVGQILPHEQDLIRSTCIELASSPQLSEEQLSTTLIKLLQTIQTDRIHFGPTWITIFSHTESDRAHGHHVSLSFPDPDYSGLMEMTIRQGQFEEKSVVIRISEFAVLIPRTLTDIQKSILRQRGFAHSVLNSATTDTDTEHKWYGIPHQDARAIHTYLEESLDSNLVNTPVLVQPPYLTNTALPLDTMTLSEELLSEQVFSDLLKKYPDLLHQIAQAIKSVDAAYADTQPARIIEQLKSIFSHYNIVIFTSMLAVAITDFLDTTPVIEENSEAMPAVYFIALFYFFLQYSIQAAQVDQLQERNRHLTERLAERESDTLFDDDEDDDFDTHFPL